MPLKIITRLKPNKLQLIQLLTGSTTSLLTDVIKGLQSSYAGNLNTSCPTCGAIGFLETTTPANTTIKVPCYTCKGYILYYTPGGELTPPTNPFGNAIIVAGVLPADIKECILEFPSSTQLDTLITALQNNRTQSLDFDCSRCANGSGGASTGNIVVNDLKMTCPTCVGMQKTVRKYQTVNGITTLADVSVPPPDPLPTPPDPNQPAP